MDQKNTFIVVREYSLSICLIVVLYSSSGFCEMLLFTSLQDPLLNEEEEEDDEEETEKPQRLVRKAWIIHLS